LSKWIDNVREVRGEEALIMIIGNKSDLEGERAVEQALANSKIMELGLSYMEVSAKTGSNIKEFFKELACVIAGGKKSKEEQSSTKQSANPAPQPIKSQQAEQKVDLSKAV
jgi:GTPase SAR1 family protein